MSETVSELTGVPGAGVWAHLALSLMGPGFPPLPPLHDRRLVLVRKDEEALDDIEDALSALAPLFPDVEPQPLAFFGEDPQRRLASLERLHAGARVALATPEGLAAAVPASATYVGERLRLGLGMRVPMPRVIEKLAALGYQRAKFVESPGEFAVRGAVVDFHPLEPLRAVRLLFNEDAVESIRVFDPETQAGAEMLDGVVLTPAVAGPSASVPVAGWLSDAGLWLVEDGLEAPPARAPRAKVGAFTGGSDYGAAPAPRFQGSLDLAAAQMREWRAAGLKVLLYSLNRGEDERVQELFEERLPEGGLQFLIGPLRSGFVLARARLAVWTTAELFARSYRPVRALRFDAPAKRARPGDLKPGDYVVHQQYGIARFKGIQPVESREGRLDCLLLEYRGADKVYVPMMDFRLVQKFVGAEGRRPRLSSLDTKSWEAVKARVREGVLELAQGLLKLEAERAARPGHGFPPDGHMETEFAQAFPYEETSDQRRAIEEVKADMTAPHPMDRLVVGDVGFGKTEVAMRAALKCAVGLKQTAVLVPTTILADQHHRTFAQRFAEYPVRVALLSRFQHPRQTREVLDGLKSGKVDIVIGTHRLLSPDVRFKDLGLLVIDEEHRFGVRHKEALKALKKDVDVLSLTATPIPRTLNQALTGMRRISLIGSAPTGRQPIVTRVGPWSGEVVARAIGEELARGGQAYYVYNKARRLPEKVRELQKLAPGARFAMAHGQMRSDPLEQTMWGFFNREHDVLVASSIIESGLDIPTVNTLLVEDAQDFGLAQLYQLRGRIGRERQRAFCYLFYPTGVRDESWMAEEARQRLRALREFAALGSGFKLALRDLEVRGAGDLLGAKQHGFINAVGVEYYAELLQEEVARLKGCRAAPEPPPVQLDLGLSAYLPEDYLPGELERLTFYKRLIAAKPVEIPVLRRELEDIAGPLPGPAANLMRLMELRAKAARAGLREAAASGGRIEVRFRSDAAVSSGTVAGWRRDYAGRLEFVRDEEGDGARVRLDPDADPVAWLEGFLCGLV